MHATTLYLQTASVEAKLLCQLKAFLEAKFLSFQCPFLPPVTVAGTSSVAEPFLRRTLTSNAAAVPQTLFIAFLDMLVFQRK